MVTGKEKSSSSLSLLERQGTGLNLVLRFFGGRWAITRPDILFCSNHP